jgi:DNA primase
MQNLELQEATSCREYLKKRNLSDKTIKKLKLGFSYNPKTSLLEYLKSKSFDESDIIKSNVVKFDNNNRLRDYFYKRLIFPIMDEKSTVVGFGGRSIDGSNPKYLNSPESDYFKKRYLLYNLSNAKIAVRKKNNLLICEGYTDVASLYEKGIESVIAPLGTSLTEQQLYLAWKHCSKPTIMFDGDSAGLRAAYKTALMSLGLISAKRFIQFIILPKNEDPDSFVNNNSFDEFVKLLKHPIPLVNFIFHQASSAHPFDSADDKIIFDKYIDEIITMIKDNKTKYFYKSEFKSLFFDRIKSKDNKYFKVKTNYKSIQVSLFQKQLYSFIAAYINHQSIRSKIADELNQSGLLDDHLSNFLHVISKPALLEKSDKELLEIIKDQNLRDILKKCLKSEIYRLFPYSSPKFSKTLVLVEIRESCNNLKTRLLYLQKINKSLDSFLENSNQLNWEELQKINKELINERI